MTGRARRNAVSSVAAVAVLVVALVAGVSYLYTAPTVKNVSTVKTLAATDTPIDFDNSLVFQPNATSTGASIPAPAISASQAFAAISDLKTMPAGVKAQYGTITQQRNQNVAANSGPDGYNYHDQAVWAFTLANTCLPQPTAIGVAAAPGRTNCTIYSFVNATTGTPILETETRTPTN
jgi:hypothetical protein